jgi:hypothetical protein
MSLSTIILTMSLKLVLGFQFNSVFALLQSPINISTSAGLMNLGSILM